MTRKIYSLIALLAFSLFQGCELSDPTENLNLIIDYNILETAIGINIIDTNTELPLETSNNDMLKITLLGEDKEKVLDPDCSYNDSYETNVGILSLAINPNYTPSQTDPINVMLKIECDGYMTTYRSVKITEEGLTNTTVDLLNLKNPPTGVFVEDFENITSISQGKVSEEIKISGNTSGMNLTIPVGTTIWDDSGNPLNGNLSIRQVVFSSTEEDAMELMPGGNGVFTNAIVEDGSKQEIEFFSAGFANFELTDESGNIGTVFNNGNVNVSYNLNEGIKNPNTGTAIQEGDKIPVWSFDESTQLWEYEKEAEVIKKDGKLCIKTKLSHFSYWNFDWWGYSSMCDYGATVTFSTGDDTDSSYICLSGNYYDKSTNAYLGCQHFYGRVNTPVSVMYAPKDRPVTIKFDYIFNGYELPDDLSISDLCTGEYSVPLSTITTKTATITIEGRCNTGDNDVIVKPTFYAVYMDLTTGAYNWVQITQGKATITGLIEGRKYRVYAYFGGIQSIDITYDGTENYVFDLDIPSDICSNF